MRLYIGPFSVSLFLVRFLDIRIEAEIEDVTTDADTWRQLRSTGRVWLASRVGALTPWMDRPIWRIG